MGRSYAYVQKQQRIKNERREEQRRRSEYGSGKREIKNQKAIEGMQQQIKALQKQKAAKPAPPKPKPKGDQQIDPVKHSPEIQSAKDKADAWLKGSQNDYSSIFKTDPNQNASGGFDIGGKGSQTSFDPMKYMQDFTGSGMQQKQQNAQTHEVEANSMSAQEILKRDKEQGWS